MSKWYEVTVQAFEVIVVEVNDDEDEETAVQVAFDEGNFTFITDKEATKIEFLDNPERIEQAKRHADEVSQLPVD